MISPDFASNSAPKILVTGACGQIGTELVAALRAKYGQSKVIASDIHARPQTEEGPYYSLDVLNFEGLSHIAKKHKITQIYHLAAVLSANGEKNPLFSWDLNMKGLLNVLEVVKTQKVEKAFWPSSIAVFGPGSPKAACPQSAVTDPTTSYGISKVAGEHWCRYYNENYGLDVRSVRFPGLISHTAKAGGGTTDYAVDIFHRALSDGAYTCFLEEGTCLPMLYMPDAVRGAIELMEAPREKIAVTTSYNLTGMHFTPKELAREIKKEISGFQISYKPDRRQRIAGSWPTSIDDRHARMDWGWRPKYDLEAMVKDMLHNLQQNELSESVTYSNFENRGRLNSGPLLND